VQLIFNMNQLRTGFGINCKQMWYICIQLIPTNHNLPLSEAGSCATMRQYIMFSHFILHLIVKQLTVFMRERFEGPKISTAKYELWPTVADSGMVTVNGRYQTQQYPTQWYTTLFFTPKHNFSPCWTLRSYWTLQKGNTNNKTL